MCPDYEKELDETLKAKMIAGEVSIADIESVEAKDRKFSSLNKNNIRQQINYPIFKVKQVVWFKDNIDAYSGEILEINGTYKYSRNYYRKDLISET